MASGWYTNGLNAVMNGSIDMDADTLRVMLVKNTYTYDKDHQYVDDGGANDPIDHECDATGYTGGHGGAGRKAVANVGQQANETNDRVDIDNDDIVYSSIGGATNNSLGGVVLYKDGGVGDSSNALIAFWEISVNTNGGDITLDFNDLPSGGNLRVST